MAFFKYKRTLGRIDFEIFGTKFTHILRNKNVNRYISLGSNCFVRMVFTRYGIKPKKKYGELSCPFDLCITPIDSLTELLENDFEGITDNVFWVENDIYKSWVNKKYSLEFVHDGELSLEELKIRYDKRIENFKNISQNAKTVKYVMACFNRNCSEEYLNRIYNALTKFRKGKKVEFIVLSFVEQEMEQIFKNINPNIMYIEYAVGDVDKFGAEWFRNSCTNIDKNLLIKIAKDVN